MDGAGALPVGQSCVIYRMLRGFYDPHPSYEADATTGDYMRQKMQFVNLHCRRQRGEKDASTATSLLKTRAEAHWNSTYRGGNGKKRKVKPDAADALRGFMMQRDSGNSLLNMNFLCAA